MTDRLREIFSLLPSCKVFADVGCDHGYVAKAMLTSGKCDKVIISDISEKCLDKARELLSAEIAGGRAVAVVSNGFENLPNCDLALIAGMGGEEIVSILKNAKNLPENLVLQPMKNTQKVRKKIIELGYAVKKDYTFLCGKIFYDLMLVSKGKDCLTEEEIEFGRTNLKDKPQGFIKFLKLKIKNLITFSKKKDLKQTTKQDMEKEAERLSKYVDDN